ATRPRGSIPILGAPELPRRCRRIGRHRYDDDGGVRRPAHVCGFWRRVVGARAVRESRAELARAPVGGRRLMSTRALTVLAVVLLVGSVRADQGATTLAAPSGLVADVRMALAHGSVAD